VAGMRWRVAGAAPFEDAVAGVKRRRVCRPRDGHREVEVEGRAQRRKADGRAGRGEGRGDAYEHGREDVHLALTDL
jgi:hypothetical protein